MLSHIAKLENIIIYTNQKYINTNRMICKIVSHYLLLVNSYEYT